MQNIKSSDLAVSWQGSVCLRQHLMYADFQSKKALHLPINLSQPLSSGKMVDGRNSNSGRRCALGHHLRVAIACRLLKWDDGNNDVVVLGQHSLPHQLPEQNAPPPNGIAHGSHTAIEAPEISGLRSLPNIAPVRNVWTCCRVVGSGGARVFRCFSLEASCSINQRTILPLNRGREAGGRNFEVPPIPEKEGRRKMLSTSSDIVQALVLHGAKDLRRVRLPHILQLGSLTRMHRRRGHSPSHILERYGSPSKPLVSAVPICTTTITVEMAILSSSHLLCSATKHLVW